MAGLKLTVKRFFRVLLVFGLCLETFEHACFLFEKHLECVCKAFGKCLEKSQTLLQNVLTTSPNALKNFIKFIYFTQNT